MQWANWLKRYVPNYRRVFLAFHTEYPPQIEVSLAVLWEGARDNPAQLKARKDIVDVVGMIHKQIQLWTDADKMKVAAARNAMDED